MTRIVIAPALAFTAVFATFGIACDGSNITNCESDDDCADVADTTPVCDTDAGYCVAEGEGEGEDQECENDLQCQVTDSGGSANCDANSDCAQDEACVEGSSGDNHCVLLEGSGCVDSVAVSTDDVGGDSVSVCVDDSVGCNADNECE